MAKSSTHAKSIRSLNQAVKICLEAGIPVPDELRVLARNEDRRARGVVQVWRCWGKSCGKEIETEVVLTAASCSCGRLCRKVWPV